MPFCELPIALDEVDGGVDTGREWVAFGSKRDLLDLALKRYFEEMFPGVEAILANGDELAAMSSATDDLIESFRIR